jgi:hypothetical protein
MTSQIEQSGPAVCATCGKPSACWAVERDEWKVCPPCHEKWLAANRWLKVEAEHAHALIDAGHVIACSTCGEQIRPGGPIRVFVTSAGEIARAYCGNCVRMYVARKRVEAIKAEILHRIGKGRSKGWLTKELLREGLHLADIREAFGELLDEGDLVQIKGVVRRPTMKKRQLALFA